MALSLFSWRVQQKEPLVSKKLIAVASCFSDEKKCHHLPLPLLSDNQVNGLVSGSGSVSSVRSSGSGEDQSQPTAPRFDPLSPSFID